MEQISPMPAQRTGFNWSDFISFRKMIALQIIQILYVLVAAIITLVGLITMFKGDSGGYGASSFMPGGFFGGLLLIVFGNVFWRLWCEFLVVLFRINKTLSDIEDNTKR